MDMALVGSERNTSWRQKKNGYGWRRVSEEFPQDFGEKIEYEQWTSFFFQSHSSMSLPHATPTSRQPQVSEDSRNYLVMNNIEDILEKKRWEVRNEGNLIDGEREEILRDYNELLPPPKKASQLGEKGPSLHPPLRRPPILLQPIQGGQTISERKKRGKLIDEELKKAINALNCGYKMYKVCVAFNIPRNLFRDHYNGRNKDRCKFLNSDQGSIE